MKQLIILMLVLILAISCVSLWACDGDDEEDGNTVAPQPTQETPAAEPVTAEPTESAGPITSEPTEPAGPITAEPSKGIAEILSQAKELNCYSYQQVATGLGVPTTTNNVWYKHGKIKMESNIQGMTTSTLIDLNEGIAYTSMMGQVMEIDITPGMGSAANQIEYVMGFNPTIKGTETIDGKECVIAEYVIDGQTERMWLWVDYGFPVKIETETPQGKVSVIYQNIDFETCAGDSTFTLPDGTKITEGGDITDIPMDIPQMP
jgi:outer membrane lipoprotein-sorting protein